MLPVITTITRGGRTREIAWAEEKVQLKDYGAGPADHPVRARQGRPADPHLRLRCVPGGDPGLAEVPVAGGELPQVRQRELRHRQDLRLHRRHRGEHQDRRNPARKKAQRRRPRSGEGRSAAAERDLAVLLADPAISPAAKNTRLIPAAEDKITAARKKLAAAAAARDTIPAKLPANHIDPEAAGRAAAHRPPRPADGAAAARAQRRALAGQPPQRLPARRRRIPRHHPPDHHPRPGRHHHLHPGPRSPSTSRQPGEPRVARALALLIEEINATPPAMPGDTRPITYQLTHTSPDLTHRRRPTSGDLGSAGIIRHEGGDVRALR